MDHYEPPSRSQRTYPQRDRPPPPSYHDAPPPPPSHGDMFHFRGAAARPGADNYRPAPRRDDFNFSAGNNAPSFAPSDNYPGARRSGRPRRGNGNARGRGGGGPPRRFGPKPAHQRDLMRHQREPTPEQLEGMNEGKESRFKVLDDLSESDSEDDDMDIESEDDHHSTASPVQIAAVNDDNSDDSEDEHPRAKRARVKSPDPSELSKPKWSNPDPYTVLPPPDESQNKKKDVVKLIRKAKVEAAKPAAAAAEGEDFISLNFDDDFAQDNSDDGGVSVAGSIRDAPSLPHKPSFSHLDHLHPDRNLPPPPPAGQPKGVNMSGPLGPRLDVWPPPADVHGGDLLGRGASQFQAGLQRQNAKDAVAPVRKDKKRKRRDDADIGSIAEEWLVSENADPAPWFANKLQGTNAEHWLHNEILDFYDYVRPRDFEKQVRDDLVRRMNVAVKQEFPRLNIRAFGSFASGLYLPTADMDLVACSDQFLSRGYAELHPSRNWMFKFANRLKKAGIADEHSVTVISQARVPLVKFVEKTTGLRVDVSFENDSGLIANDTFQIWKQQYPAMPIIVSLIKQFLVMRGFSEVFSGGLGGYSVICLTISILRILEQRNGRDWDPMQSLDTVLMTFLVHFGRDFDTERDGIQMNPWEIIDKRDWRGFKGKPSKPDRLLIVDPNNYANDISGGSGSVLKIFEKFADAFRELNICMSDAEDTYKESGDIISILERIWGGNYELFETQRARLKTVWQQSMASGSNNNFPRGSNQGGYQGGNNGSYGGSQGKPGTQNSGIQGKQNNHPKQGKRPADGDSGPNKKQKTSNDVNQRPPLHNLYEDNEGEKTAGVSGPAQAAGKRKKSSDEGQKKPSNGNIKKDSSDAGNPEAPDQPSSGPAPNNQPKKSKKKKDKKNKNKDGANPGTGNTRPAWNMKDRANAFKRTHPDVADVPNKLGKKAYKKLKKEHGKGNA